MPELDDDALRAALRDLYDSALSQVRPPGAEAVRRRVRRRAATRVAALATAGVALITIAFTIAPNGRTPSPIDTGSPSTTASFRPTPSSAPSPGPSPSPTAEPSTAAGNSPGPISTYCANDGYVFNSGDDVWSATIYPNIHPSNICPGEVRPFFWANYIRNPDGSQSLYQSASFVLTYENPSVRTSPRFAPGPCSGAMFVVVGDIPILETIPFGVADPYPPFNPQTRSGTIRGSNYYYQDPCPSPSP